MAATPKRKPGAGSDPDAKLTEAIRSRVLAKRLQLRSVSEQEGTQDWTQEDVAERAEISTTTYERIEQGRTLPNIRILAKIAEAFDCQVSDLVP